MRSTAQIKGHPLHPVLIAFPVAFGFAAPIADLVGILAEWPTVWMMGAYLSAATVIFGLVAGVPGFLDYLYTVPPNSSAKTRATQHMVVNLTALSLFAITWAFRDLQTLRPNTTIVVLEFLGLGIMTVGGWMGGTLVYRNQIGVDHRYADAGKWQEQTIEGTPGTTVDVGGMNDLEVGQLKLLHANGRRIVLLRTQQGYTATDDRCPHKGGSLAGGVPVCGVLVCPWHGSQFDARTGQVKAGPANQPIATYPVEEVGGRVRIVLPQP